jgi:type I restriction enzyme R subunit
MDKVLLQIESDYAAEEKWHSYAEGNDLKILMLLFEEDFPIMAATRFEKNDEFYVHLSSDPDMMKQVMETVGMILYQRLMRKRMRK